MADAGVAYNAERWRVALTMNNLFDKDYYAGGVRNAVALGNGRTTLLTVGLRH